MASSSSSSSSIVSPTALDSVLELLASDHHDMLAAQGALLMQLPAPDK
jgi:hypothetical protein